MSRNLVMRESNSNVTERKTKIAGNTAYKLVITYKKNGETLDKILLQQMELSLSVDK